MSRLTGWSVVLVLSLGLLGACGGPNADNGDGSNNTCHNNTNRCDTRACTPLSLGRAAGFRPLEPELGFRRPITSAPPPEPDALTEKQLFLLRPFRLLPRLYGYRARE